MNHSQTSSKYFVPEPSIYPIFGSIALLLMGLGAALWVNDVIGGPIVLFTGLAFLVYMLFTWFGEVVRESESGKYNQQVDRAFRWSMSWFIFSEVMFFGAFFGALLYIRWITLPQLGNADTQLLWPGFQGEWPSDGPYFNLDYLKMGWYGLPLINTLLLLTSAVTLTIAHHALRKGLRGRTNFFLAATVALGVIFLGCQAYEYHHAYSEGLKLSTGIYGSLFYIMTGFHGLHVTVGAIMLAAVLARSLKGHFTPERHFAFEAAAWYWHFVDYVWLLLFVVVYVL